MSSPSVPPAIRRPSEPQPQRYEVKTQLAQGGMGVVYRARDRVSGLDVALKRVLVRDHELRDFQTAALEREYQVLASIDHPRIIRVLDYGVDADGPYYTMELVEGRDLRHTAPLPWRDVCLYMRDLASSLSLLHARRLLHRDLSPGNVKIGLDGHAKLLDFGALSDFGQSTSIVGTPPLVPPEALRGDALDQRSDLYALGTLAYWALTGEHAYPADHFTELANSWSRQPPPPSGRNEEVPKALDHLVMSLISRDPLARPARAAEVIARLDVIGQLPPEDERDRRRLARSFLVIPPFVGRDKQLGSLLDMLVSTREGRGSSVRVVGGPGVGRSRLLEEIVVRAQVAGTGVVRVDAAMHPNHQGTCRAIALRLLDTLPTLARAAAKPYAHALTALGRDVEGRVGLAPSNAPRIPETKEATLELDRAIPDWMVDIARLKPLVIAVDNIDSCDIASLAVLIALANRVQSAAVLLTLSERTPPKLNTSKGVEVLRGLCHTLVLTNLAASETLALARSLFGDAPNVERFGEFLYRQTAGNPLHCMEAARQLIADKIVLYEGGAWILPSGRPQVDLPEALEDALRMRMRALSREARELVHCLGLHRGEPTFELCSELVGSREGRPRAVGAHELLDELARQDVLRRDHSGYRFSSSALRESIVGGLDNYNREECHKRLGEAFVKLSLGERTPLLEAGWHFLLGGQEQRGADLVASVQRSAYGVRALSANGHQLGPVIKAALRVYKRRRSSAYERLPLLAGIAHAAFYEDVAEYEQFGDEALDVVEDISGLRTARRLQGWLGRHVALVLGLLSGYLRFLLTPRAERPYSFTELLEATLATVIALVGTATISLDAARADRIARIVEPFSILPKKATARGVHDFCFGLQQVAREHQSSAFKTFDHLAAQFADPHWYPRLADDARGLLLAATHFARGTFAVFRADSAVALSSVEVLESSGYAVYLMIAAQLRYLYHANRGELAEATRQRARVDLHAARAGSAWQVELWESAATLPLLLALDDVAELARVVKRFDELVHVAPSLELYRRLSELSLVASRDEQDERPLEYALRELESRPPRSFIGWTATIAGCAAVLNRAARYAKAREVCERAIVLLRDEDRAYVTLFLNVELQAAAADAGLGETQLALERVDKLLALHASSAHPLALGQLHEMRARISYSVGYKRDYHYHRQQMEHWFRSTKTPALIARCERVAELDQAQTTAKRRPF